MRRALSPVPCAARPSAAASGMLSRLGVAVASAATDSCEACVCTVATLVSSSIGFFASFGVTTRSGSSVSVGVSFGRSVSLTSAFCSASAGEATDASVSGPGGRSVASCRRRGSSRPISIAGAPRASSSIIGLQMRHRQRRAAEMERERGEPAQSHSRREGWCLGVEVRHLDQPSQGFAAAAAAGCDAASGTPSSATSLIFV